MENIYLKYPEEQDEKEWLDYVLEYRKYDYEYSPLSYTLNTDYKKWVKKQEMHRNGITHKDFPIPTSVFFLMCDQKIIGTLVLRHSVSNEYLFYYSGHIKIGIRPTERNKGYGTMLLNMALEKSLEIGLDEIYLISEDNNTPALRLIEKAGGTLCESPYDNFEEKEYKKYLVKIKRKVKKL